MSVKPHPTKGPGWWYIIISHGRKGSKNYQPPEYITFQGTEVEAKAYENELRGIEPGNNGRVKVIDLLDNFLKWHKTNRGEGTHDNCQQAFKQLLPFLGEKYIAYLRHRDYEPFKTARLNTRIVPKRRKHRKDRKVDSRAETDEQYAARCDAETRMVCKRTVQIELDHFSTFLRWAKDVEHYTVGDFPKRFSKEQQKAKAKVVLALSEIPELIDQQKEGFQKTLTMLMLQNGLRRTEANTLRKRNVDLKNNCLIITGKKNKTRTVPIVSQELFAALEKACKDKKRDDYLFINPKTKRPYRDIKKSLKHAAVAAGIEKRVYNHLMRHSFCTTAIVAGVPVAVVRDLAGHEDIRTTQDYVNLVSEHHQAEVKKIASVMSGINKDSKGA